MDTLEAVIEFVLRPFVAWAALALVIGQVVKTQVFTRDRATKAETAKWFWRWARKTMALHPAAAGALVGWFWPGVIEEGYAGGELSGVIYFGASGAAAVWIFEVVKGVAKKRYGIELGKLPGTSHPPPDLEGEDTHPDAPHSKTHK